MVGMEAYVEEPLGYAEQRGKTSRRRTPPPPPDIPETLYFARLAILSRGPWHVIEIASAEDWFYLEKDLAEPAPMQPHLEIWVQFDKTCMRLYPSDDPEAREILYRKLTYAEHLSIDQADLDWLAGPH